MTIVTGRIFELRNGLGAGTAWNDRSRNKHDGVLSGTYAWADGPLGKCVDFTSGVCTVTHHQDLNITNFPFTMEFLAKLDGVAGAHTIIGKGADEAGSNQNYQILTNGTDVVVAIGDGAGGSRTYTASTGLAVGWHHIVAVITGLAAGVVYVDGAAYTPAYAGAAAALVANASNLTICASLGGTPQSFDGETDYAAIYKDFAMPVNMVARRHRMFRVAVHRIGEVME